MILALLFGCPDPEPPLESALAALNRGDDAALQDQLDQLPNAITRDMLLLELATAEPQQGGRLCARITTDYGREKCQKVVGRPHLQGVGP